MAHTVSMHYAKTHFATLLARLNTGEEIVITKAGKPVARLSPIPHMATGPRVPGIDKGKIWMAKGFYTMTNRELEDWYSS